MNERVIMEYFIGIIIGLVVGVSIGFIVNRILQKQKRQDQENLIKNMENTFGELSRKALSQNSSEFLKLADQNLSKQTQEGTKELDTKKQLIDQTLGKMETELKNVNDLVRELEKDREGKFGELTKQLDITNDLTGKLQKATNQLNSALYNTKVRGQWGQRMAEDILNLVGLKEGINYVKQKTSETTGKRPDYTFLLPQNLKVNMDVKFPLNSYLHYLDAESVNDKDKHKSQFKKDVRNRIKEVTTSREYINPEDNTVDYVIVFIPNEQVYAFANENDGDLLNEALKNKVILCSPVTLYAVLTLIRQSVDNFRLERNSTEILSLLEEFYKKWEKFVGTLNKMGKMIDETQKEYKNLIGSCQDQLGSCLEKIDDLREQSDMVTQISDSNGDE
jgi:DNA recombination protein RmuC